MTTTVQTRCPLEALPDNLLANILALAALTKIGDPLRKVADFRKLARLRTVSSRFSRVALQVDGIVCPLDTARAMDARILFFLQEAEAIRKLFLKCKLEMGQPMSSIAGFVAAAVNLTPTLEHFFLQRGNLVSEVRGSKSDEPAQQIFKALSKCPLLKTLELYRCKLLIEGRLHVPAPFHNLKQLSLRGSELPFTDSVLVYPLDQVAPTLEKLTLNGLFQGSKLRIESKTLRILEFDDPYGEKARKVDIDTPQLEELYLSVSSEELRIYAPKLRTLKFQWPPGVLEIRAPWKVTELDIEGTWYEQPFLQVLRASPELACLTFTDFSFGTNDIVRATEFMASLARLESLEANRDLLAILRTLTLHSRELTLPLHFGNLTNLLVAVNNMEELQFCIDLVEGCPKLAFLEIDMRGVRGELTNLVNIFLELRDTKPDLVIVVFEPNFVSA